MLCGTLAASVTLLRGGSMVFKGTLSLGVLSAFMTYALSLFQTFRQQAARISQLISLQANVERVVDLIDEKPTVQDSPEVEAKYGDCFHPKMENWEEMRGEIDFDDVSFTYPDGGEEVLTHFSLHVPAGSTVAIVGETGAGKSTLVNLVCRFFEPTAGRVLIDGRDACERSQLWLHSHVAMCCNRRTCSPARFVKTSAMASRTRRTKRSMRRLRRSAQTASRPSSNRAMTRTWASAATSSPRAKNSSFPSLAR
ncbi:MAG: ATP-binding cassette domain-containing protein [Christensenellales bacterium]